MEKLSGNEAARVHWDSVAILCPPWPGFQAIAAILAENSQAVKDGSIELLPYQVDVIAELQGPEME